MRILLVLAVIVLVAGSFYADYKWRQWMAARRGKQEGDERDESAR